MIINRVHLPHSNSKKSSRCINRAVVVQHFPSFDDVVGSLVGMAACICSAADSELPVCDPYRTSISSVSFANVVVIAWVFVYIDSIELCVLEEEEGGNEFRHRL